jgi:hypothetical protein
MFNAMFKKIEEVISDVNASEMKLQEYEVWLSNLTKPGFTDEKTKKRAEELLKKIKEIREKRKKKIEKTVLSFFG